MKFLIDMPLSPALAVWLIGHGHQAIHALDLGLAQAPDDQILQRARMEGQIIITADLDYPRLLALSAADSPPIILFRGGNYSETEMLSLLASVLRKIDANELSSSFVVVDRHRIRKRPLPLR